MYISEVDTISVFCQNFIVFLTGPEKHVMTEHQTQVLNNTFQAKSYLDKIETRQLSRLLNLSERRIGMWFASSRFKRRRKESLPKG